MAKLTYENKTAINENPSIPAVNKGRAVDWNEIKQVVNYNDNNKINDLIQVGISVSPWNLSANTLTTIPFDTVSQQIGNLLSLSSNKIVIGGNNIQGKLRL